MTRTFAGNLLGSEQYHIIIQLNNRSVKDRSFSRKIESERSFLYLKFILSDGFQERLIQCIRERRFYGDDTECGDKSFA